MVAVETPSRSQLARLVDNDPELLILLERLFDQAGTTTPDAVALIDTDLSAINAAIVINTAAIAAIEAGIAGLGSGIATLDFGLSAKTATVVVSGVSQITAESIMLCKMRIEATDDHPAEDLLIDPIRVEAFEIVAGVGFTIYGTMENAPANGKYNVQWALS
jgi:hypothetical protein